MVTSVGPAASLPTNAHPTVVHGTCLPGLIDAHVHLTSDPVHAGYQGLGVSIPRQAVLGVKNARLTLQAGFTTVRNVGRHGFCRRGIARRRQCRRCRGAAHAGQRPGARNYRRPRRQQSAAV
ncbi:MAG: hypothetical protein WDN04_05955 [Rhodospirillales bacterium]